MQSRKIKLHAPDAELAVLDKDLLNIHRQYIELDDAILYGQGSARILEAAGSLVQYLLLHSTHVEQMQNKQSFSVRQDQRNVWKKNLAGLLQIEAGLRQEEIYAALRLRSFCKGWMHENVSMERVMLEIAASARARHPGKVSA